MKIIDKKSPQNISFRIILLINIFLNTFINYLITIFGNFIFFMTLSLLEIREDKLIYL